VVEELDDLAGHCPALVAAPVGRHDEHVLLIHGEEGLRRPQWDAVRLQAQPLHEAVRGLGGRREVDEVSHVTPSEVGCVAGPGPGWSRPGRRVRATRPKSVGQTATEAACAASALILSGRKPDQWSPSAKTTGACW